MAVVAGGVRQRSLKNNPANIERTRGFGATQRSVECEFIGSSLRLEELEEDWSELWSSLDDAAPFQSPDWLLPWWKSYGEGQLFSFAFWDGARLIGLAPLYIFQSPNDQMRKLFLLGTGNSDYMDVLFDPASRTQCWSALLAGIQNRKEQWDVCSFQRLRPGSPMLDEIGDASGLEVEMAEQIPCVAVDLQKLGHGEVLLKRSQAYARKLQSMHPYRFEEVTAETLPEFSEALERLHQQRWREEKCQGALSNARDRSFHRQVARRFFEAKRLMFYGIRMAGKLIAVIYGFRGCSRVYSYLSGFDTEFAQKSVGAISIGYAVKRSIESGYKAYDFLQGQEPYKYTWGAQDVPCLARTIVKK